MGQEGYASGGYTSMENPAQVRVVGIPQNNVHSICSDERVARLYELVKIAPKLQLRVIENQ